MQERGKQGGTHLLQHSLQMFVWLSVNHIKSTTQSQLVSAIFCLRPWFESQHQNLLCFHPNFPDQHHWAGSWGPRPRRSGAAVHGQPELAGHPLQLLHRAAHAQHQSLSKLQKWKEIIKARRFKNKKKNRKTERDGSYCTAPWPSSNL